MPKHACFRLVAGSTLIVLASAGAVSAAGDPYHLSQSEIEQAFASPFPEDAGPSEPVRHPLVQRAADESGSDATSPANPPEPDVWAEAFAESARLGAVAPPPPAPHYPVIVNAQVERFIEHYTVNRREVVGMWLSRSQRYVGMIREVLRAQGLPEDLMFVAMVESGYNPLAVSRAGAKGLWQFMAGTARQYGLRVDQWVDERFDPEKSTAAAAAYLRDLYQQFGSWLLAKAAYNAGEVKVIRAMKALGTTDFWTLAGSRFLKQETKEYVPAIHAATVIGRDPSRFGFEPAEPTPVAFERVAVPPSTNLRSLAAAVGLPTDAIRELNPVLVRGVTPPGGTYQLKVPAGATELIAAALVPKPSAPRRGRGDAQAPAADVHVVRPNETLGAIARTYGVSVADLVRWNDLEHPERIRP